MPRGIQISDEEVLHRRKEILNIGSIPEFVKVKNLIDFYKILTEANLKNKIL